MDTGTLATRIHILVSLYGYNAGGKQVNVAEHRKSQRQRLRDRNRGRDGDGDGRKTAQEGIFRMTVGELHYTQSWMDMHYSTPTHTQSLVVPQQTNCNL